MAFLSGLSAFLEVYQDLRSVFNCNANQLCGTCVLDVMEAESESELDFGARARRGRGRDLPKVGMGPVFGLQRGSTGKKRRKTKKPTRVSRLPLLNLHSNLLSLINKAKLLFVAPRDLAVKTRQPSQQMDESRTPATRVSNSSFIESQDLLVIPVYK